MKKCRLPRLSRGGKIVRNLTLVILSAVFVWGLACFPLPPRLDFRRVERENLIGPGEIQGVFLSADRWRVVGTEEDLVIWTGGQSLFYDSWPRNGDGPTLVPMISRYYGPEAEFEVMAVDVPQGTRSARLDIALDCWYCQSQDGAAWVSTGAPRPESKEEVSWQRLEKDCRAEGEPLRDGGVLFRVPLEDMSVTYLSMEEALFQSLTWQNTYRQPSSVRGVNCRMEAVFYDEAGRELGRAALATPEDGDSAAG